jgi:chromosome segregation ATPase
VIESVMVFALGFLAATLISLLIIPAVNARAERLARRRAEALFPMSISELTAEKDHLRAEFAVLQRKLERRAEDALAVKHQSLEELGRRAVRIESLETQLAERDRTISDLEQDLAETRKSLAETVAELDSTRTSLSGARDTLAALEEAHRRTLTELSATRDEFERTGTTVAEMRAELGTGQDRFSKLEAEYQDLTARWDGVLNDLDAKRITISDIETRLATQFQRAEDLERSLRERDAELAEERQRLTDLAGNLLAEQERVIELEARIRELEGERDATSVEDAFPVNDTESSHSTREGKSPAFETDRGARTAANLEETPALNEDRSEVRSLVGKLEAEKASLESALATAREDGARLSQELEAARNPDASNARIAAENEDLRRRISELADTIMQANSSANSANNSAKRMKGRRNAAR